MKLVYKTFSRIFILTILIKLVDVVKSLIIASKFGVSSSADIYMAVTAIPDSMIVLLGLDTLRGVVNSEYSSFFSKKEISKIFNSYQNLFNVIFIISLIVVIILFILRRQVVSILLPGFSGERYEIALDIAFIVFPVMFFRVFIGFFQSIFNSFHKFYVPIVAPLAGTAIVFVAIFLPYYKGDLIYNLSYSVLAGNIFISLILFYGIFRMGGKPVFKKIELDDISKKVLKNCLSILILVTCNQLYTFSRNFFASYYGKGAISALNYANYLPVSISTMVFTVIFNVLLTNLSTMFSTEKLSNAKSLFFNTFLGLFFIMVPISILFIVNSKEVLTLVYLRGNFDIDGLLKTLKPFFWESLSLMSFVFYIVPTALYLAKKEYLAMTKIGSVVYLSGILLNYVFTKYFDYYGVAISGFFVSGIYGLLLLLYSRKIFGYFGVYFKQFALIMLSGLISFILVYIFKEFIFGNYSNFGFANSIIVISVTSFLIILVYFFISYIFKVNYSFKLREILSKNSL